MFSAKPSQSLAPINLLHLLQLSITNKSLKLTQKTHAQICYLGLNRHPVIITNLINAYFSSNSPAQSRKLFDFIRHKDIYLWNTMISGFVKNNLYNECFNFFNNMCWNIDSFPDEFTFSTLAKVSGVIGDLPTGKWVHGKSIKLGLLSDTVLTNSLMSMYSKCDRIHDARKLFDKMPHRSVSSWNVMLSRYVIGNSENGQNPYPDYEVWEFLKSMLTEGLKPNGFTLSNLLPLSIRLGKFDYGKQLHCYIIRNEMKLDLDSYVHLDCCLIDMYSRNGNINLARLIFDKTKFKNVFTWTTMMNGYLQNNDPDRTVFLFRDMLRNEVEPNEVSGLTLLSACSLIAGLFGVKQIHGFSVKKGFENHTALSNSFIDMYSKNGLLKNARKVFENECFLKNEISWSSMISGYGLHGKGQEAVDLYDKMVNSGIKSDAITIVGVLSACSKSGLVEKGLDVYNKAVTVYGIDPTVEMCSCVVDLLGRSGQLGEALTFIKTMPLEPGPSVWGALVSASLVHSNYEMKVLAYKSLIEIEPENASNYVSLSNLYADCKKWDCVGDVRRTMNERSLRKLPGCSWIRVNRKIHRFFIADKAHSAADQIYEILNGLILVMKKS